MIALPKKLDRTARLYGLTDREREVVALLAAGETWKAAADKLHISPRTIEAYVARVRMKMHAPNMVAVLSLLYGNSPTSKP
jgi:DNA-binding NarL/FixJ family response regulator